MPAGLTPDQTARPPVAEGGTVEPGRAAPGTQARGRSPGPIAELAPGATPQPRHYQPAGPRTLQRRRGLREHGEDERRRACPAQVAGERTAASVNHAGYEAEATDSVKLIEAGLTKGARSAEGDDGRRSTLTYTLNLKLQSERHLLRHHRRGPSAQRRGLRRHRSSIT